MMGKKKAKNDEMEIANVVEAVEVSGSKLLRDFANIFQGNMSFYIKHQIPFRYSPKNHKLVAKFCGFAKDRGDFLPVTLELYREHLNGGNGLAIAPLTNTDKLRNVCFFAVIDIDVYDVNYVWLVKRLYQLGFKFAAFRSKSGGLHIYFFFRDPEPADKAIETLNRLIESFGLSRLYTNNKAKNKVEVFPKQAVFTSGEGGMKANCLFLPFYNAAAGNECGQRMFTGEGKLMNIDRAMPVIEGMFTTLKDMNAMLDALPYDDAPYCIQVICLTGALEEGDFRNNFLFYAALYFKLRLREGFFNELKAINDCLENALDIDELEAIYNSAMSKDWPFLAACKKEPFMSYCHRTFCKARKYGVGKDRDNFMSNVEFGKLTRVLTMDPYYIWDVRLDEKDEYKQVVVGDETELLNQKTIQQVCIRALNTTPLSMNQRAWEIKVNECLAIIEEQQVAKATDTTDLSVLHSCFVRYLTHKQIVGGQPYMVANGAVYHGNGYYYFDTLGFVAYMRSEHFSFGRINLREQLSQYGCVQAVLTYRTRSGKEQRVSCWRKADDEELVERGTFYEDLYDGDAGVIDDNKSSDEGVGDEEAPDDGTKF